MENRTLDASSYLRRKKGNQNRITLRKIWVPVRACNDIFCKRIHAKNIITEKADEESEALSLHTWIFLTLLFCLQGAPNLRVLPFATTHSSPASPQCLNFSSTNRKFVGVRLLGLNRRPKNGSFKRILPSDWSVSTERVWIAPWFMTERTFIVVRANRFVPLVKVRIVNAERANNRDSKCGITILLLTLKLQVLRVSPL